MICRVNAYFVSAIILVVASPALSTAQPQQPQAVDYEIKMRNSDFRVPIRTGYDFAGDDVAWLIPFVGSNTALAHTRTAKEVMDAFLNQPLSTQKNGIRLQSDFYLVSFNREKLSMSPFQRQQYNNPAYRKSESELVDQMKAECEARGIALFINTSMDLKKPWRLLTDEKTIKGMKDLKPVKRATP